MNKREGKRNLFDILLFMTLVIGVFGVAARFYIKNNYAAKSNESADIVFELRGVGRESIFAMEEGEEISMRQGKKSIGTLHEITEIREYSEISFSDDGALRLRAVPEKYVVRGVIRAHGAFTDSGFMLGGNTHIAPNQTIEADTVKLSTSIYIVDIERV